MSIRFLHTADWQLGKPFANVPGDIGALLRKARFEAVETLASIAQERSADAVLVAGDIFDSPWPDASTLYAALNAMRGFGGPWLLLPGNHDAAENSNLWQRLAAMAEGVELQILLQAEALSLMGGAAIVLPAPLRQRHGFEDATEWMNAATTPISAIRIGLAHGSIRNFGDNDVEANPIAPDRAAQAKLDYLALGDWHGTTRISEHCWYSGTPEIDDFPDNDPGHALWVEIDAPGAVPRVETLPTSRFVWKKLKIGHVSDAQTIIDTIQDVIVDAPRADRLLLAIELAGTIDLAGRAKLEIAMAEWQARLGWLRLNDQLRDAPSEADILALAGGRGVVAATAQQLAHADDLESQQALRLLYSIAMRDTAREQS